MGENIKPIGVLYIMENGEPKELTKVEFESYDSLPSINTPYEDDIQYFNTPEHGELSFSATTSMRDFVRAIGFRNSIKIFGFWKTLKHWFSKS